MAALAKDVNSVAVAGGVADNDSTVILPFKVNHTTGRIMLTSTVASGGGLTSINADTTAAQLLTVGTTGTDFAIVDDGIGGHAFNLPSASATARGLVTTGSQTLAGAKTFSTAPLLSSLTVSQILALDGSGNIQSLAVATYPSLTELSYVKGVTSAIQTQLNSKGAGTVTAVSVATANGVSGSSSGGSTPALTITLGAITPSTVNGNTFTTGSSTYTGTAAQTYTFPTTTASIARTDAAQTFTGTQTFSQVITTANTVTVTTNAGTVPVTSRVNNFTNSSASAMTITMATASAVDGQISMVRIFDATAATKGITWVNTENSAGVTAPATSAGSTTIPLTVGFQFNSGTTKWTCLASS